MNTRSSKPRKQRKALATAPLHRKSKELRAHLDPAKYGSSGVKRITLRTGDTVKVVRGSRQGHEGNARSQSKGPFFRKQITRRFRFGSIPPTYWSQK